MNLESTVPTYLLFVASVILVGLAAYSCVPQEHRPRLFESGYTTSSTGTGFGLAIVKGVVEAHGWEIAYETGRDGGARFVVTGVSVEDDIPAPPASSVSASPDDAER